jgi:hypothetical protein
LIDGQGRETELFLQVRSPVHDITAIDVHGLAINLLFEVAR